MVRCAASDAASASTRSRVVRVDAVAGEGLCCWRRTSGSLRAVVVALVVVVYSWWLVPVLALAALVARRFAPAWPALRSSRPVD